MRHRLILLAAALLLFFVPANEDETGPARIPAAGDVSFATVLCYHHLVDGLPAGGGELSVADSAAHMAGGIQRLSGFPAVSRQIGSDRV